MIPKAVKIPVLLRFLEVDTLNEENLEGRNEEQGVGYRRTVNMRRRRRWENEGSLRRYGS